MLLRAGTFEDKERLYELDHTYFSANYQVPHDFVERVLARNPSVYRVIESDGKIHGYYGMLPLLQTDFENVLKGTLAEKDLADRVVSFDEPTEVHLYLIGFIVDQAHPQAEEITTALLRDLVNFVHDLILQGFSVPTLGTIAVTLKGIKFCSRLGMKECGVVGHDVAFRLTLSKNTINQLLT